MIAEEEPTEREQTDESLRAERERADHALGEKLAAIEETADAVIIKARERADEVLAAARAKTDEKAGPRSRSSVVHERVLEDRAVEDERAIADETVRAERAETVALLATERQETDKDLLSERTESDNAVATRDEFLGIVSHDLRNMLNSVIGYAALIAQGVEQDNFTNVLAHAQRIQRSGGRMNRLVGDLVDVASIEAGMLAVAREVGDPAPVVLEATDTFQAQASASGITLLTEIASPPCLIAFDPSRLLQVLTNLLSNAIKFTGPNGKVVVRVEPVGSELVFSVSDTGVGIPSDKLHAIFDRFVQVSNDRRGVGLGLYISKCIVQGHAGRIWAESAMGTGSTVSFAVPLHTS